MATSSSSRTHSNNNQQHAESRMDVSISSSSCSSSQSALRRQAHFAPVAPAIARPRVSQDTLLQQPTRRSASVEYEASSLSFSWASSLQQQQHQNNHHARGRSAPPLGYFPHQPNSNHHNNKPPALFDPEEVNEEEMEDFLHDDSEDHDGVEDPIPVSGWSLVEVSNEPGAGVPPSARSLHAATMLVSVGK